MWCSIYSPVQTSNQNLFEHSSQYNSSTYISFAHLAHPAVLSKPLFELALVPEYSTWTAFFILPSLSLARMNLKRVLQVAAAAFAVVVAVVQAIPIPNGAEDAAALAAGEDGPAVRTTSLVFAFLSSSLLSLLSSPFLSFSLPILGHTHPLHNAHIMKVLFLFEGAYFTATVL